ncbi:MAG: TetR/AcrR family transcriptional regulator [Streptosporangiaceae bacterium]
MRSDQSISMAGDAGGTFTSTARRAQFVAAAIETIAEAGYARASLGRIAERVGVSKGVISYHFAGKEELVQEVIADIAAKGGAFVYARAMTLPTAAGRLRAWIESVLEYTATHRTETVAFQEISAGSRGDAAVSAAVARLATDVAPAVRALFADGQASGEFREDFDPQAAATALIAVLDAVPPRMARDPDFDVAGYGREVAGLFDAATRRAAPAEGTQTAAPQKGSQE